ncbi:Hypothetical protein FKW44_008032, partial [Caligus rogercresseyi]
NNNRVMYRIATLVVSNPHPMGKEIVDRLSLKIFSNSSMTRGSSASTNLYKVLDQAQAFERALQ